MCVCVCVCAETSINFSISMGFYDHVYGGQLYSFELVLMK